MVNELGFQLLTALMRAKKMGFPHDAAAIKGYYLGIGHAPETVDDAWSWVERVLAIGTTKRVRPRKTVDTEEDWG